MLFFALCLYLVVLSYSFILYIYFHFSYKPDYLNNIFGFTSLLCVFFHVLLFLIIMNLDVSLQSFFIPLWFLILGVPMILMGILVLISTGVINLIKKDSQRVFAKLGIRLQEKRKNWSKAKKDTLRKINHVLIFLGLLFVWYIGLILAKLFKIPFIFFYIDILHEIVPISYVKKLARVVSLFTLKRSDKVLVHTKIQYKYLLYEGFSPKNIDICPDGISLENTIVNKKKFENLKSKYSINDNDFVIFFMGYLYEFAGLKEIIDYYNPKVHENNLNLKFLILGDGGIYNFLRSYIKKVNANWVILAGRVPYSEITEFIELADLCLLSFAINDITKETSLEIRDEKTGEVIEYRKLFALKI